MLKSSFVSLLRWALGAFAALEFQVFEIVLRLVRFAKFIGSA
jgi:hypothetical protein